MTQDQVFVPSTRSELGLKPLDPLKEDRLGSRVSEEVKQELWEALGDSPIGAALGSASYLVSRIFLSRAALAKVIVSLEDGQHISCSILLVKNGIPKAPTVSHFSYTL